jgi:hypothetical protein
MDIAAARQQWTMGKSQPTQLEPHARLAMLAAEQMAAHHQAAQFQELLGVLEEQGRLSEVGCSNQHSLACMWGGCAQAALAAAM